MTVDSIYIFTPGQLINIYVDDHQSLHQQMYMVISREGRTRYFVLTISERMYLGCTGFLSWKYFLAPNTLNINSPALRNKFHTPTHREQFPMMDVHQMHTDHIE